MESKSKNPNKLLPVFHQFDDFKLLRKVLTHKRPDGTLIDYICISPRKTPAGRKLYKTWFSEVHKMILKLNPTVNVHVLGFTQLKEIRAYE